MRAELAEIIEKCAPETLYIHNFADKHDTHVATALRAAEAVRAYLRRSVLRKYMRWRSGEAWTGSVMKIKSALIRRSTQIWRQRFSASTTARLQVASGTTARRSADASQMQHFMPAIIRTALKAAPTESTLRISSMERKRRRRSSARIFGNLKMKWGADSGGFHNAIT